MTAPTPPTTLDQALIQVIQKTTGAVENGVAFLSAQLPDVIQQLLVWHATKAGVTCLALSLMVALCLTVLWKLWQRAKKKDDPFIEAMSGAVIGALGVIFAFEAFEQGLKLLQILIAPKLYLIEYVAQLMKG